MNETMKKLSLSILSALLLCMPGCKEVELKLPDIEPSIYFATKDWGVTKNEPDEADNAYTFFFQTPETKALLTWVNLSLAGDLAEVERPVAIRQITEYVPGYDGVVRDEDYDFAIYAATPLPADKYITDAKAFGGDVEADYVAIDHPRLPEFVEWCRENPDVVRLDKDLPGVLFMGLRPRSNGLHYPIILLRDPGQHDLELEHPLELRMVVEQNEWFIPGIATRRNYVITVTDVAGPPSNWASVWEKDPTSGATRFGVFGLEKFALMNQATPGFDWELMERPAPWDDEMKYMIAKTRALLVQYKATHGKDLTEKDGTVVTL